MERVFEIKGSKDADLLEWEVLMEQGKLTVKAKSKVLTAFFAHASRGKTVQGDFGERFLLDFPLSLPVPTFFGDCGGMLSTNDGNYNLSWMLNTGLKDGITVTYTDIVPWSAVQSLNRAIIAVVKALQGTYLRSTGTGGRISVHLSEDLEGEIEEVIE